MRYHTKQEAFSYDLIRRFEEHVNGLYETCYTFKRRPLVLKYYETIPFFKDAVEREKQIKGWFKPKKKALIEGNFDKLQLLSQCNNFSLIINIKIWNKVTTTLNPKNNPFDFVQCSPK